MLSILFLSIIAPTVFDTGLYHAQSIQWIENYPVVPGLGNIHERLAFNSSFFVVSAFYSWSFLNISPLYTVNSYLFFLLITRSIINIINEFHNRNLDKLFIYSAIIILSISYFNDKISSPMPDICASIMILYIFYIVIDDRCMKFNNINFLHFTIFILSFLLITVKLSTICILIIVPYILLKTKVMYVNPNQCITVVILATIIILPWIIRNVILSGYLVFPFTQIDIFSFDWKIPFENALNHKNYILSWSRIPYKNWNEVLPLPLKTWVPVWYKSQFFISKVILNILIINPIIVMYLFLVKRQYLNNKLLIFWLISLCGVIFWFLSAPDFRFGYAFIFICSIIPIALIIKIWLKSIFIRYFIVVFLGLYSLLFIYIYKDTFLKIGEKPIIYFFKPEPIKHVETVEKRCANFLIKIPAKEKKCYNSEIPCVPNFRPDLEMRGKSYRNGFKRSNNIK